MIYPMIQAPFKLLRTGLISITVMGTLMWLNWVYAHGTEHPTRFIASDGVDIGDCTDSHNPCLTLGYSVELSNKGDTIKVAQGEYYSSGTDVFYLLSGLVKIEAGYSRSDHFQQRDIKRHRTTFYGVPHNYRQKIQKMGFQAVGDAKAKDIKLSAEEIKMIGSFEALNKNNQAFTACQDGFAGQFECNRIDLQSRMPASALHANNPSLNDIWGFVDLNDNREYALVGLTNGTSVVDITNPVSPVLVGHVPGFLSTWRDLKAYQYFDTDANEYKAYAYVTTEAMQGMQIIDLTDLPNSISLVATINDFSNAHNIYIGNIDYSTGMALPGLDPVIYVSGSNAGGGAFRAYNLTNPIAPELVSSAPAGTGYVHDVTSMVITDERTSQCAFQHNPCEILIDFNENAVEIWDLTNKDSPFKISSTTYTNVGYTHSGWYSEDKMFVFVQDETDEINYGGNTVLRTMDISDLANPFISNVYSGPTQAIDHNGFALGDYYYMSNYRRGLTVLNVSDPNQPVEAGFFDTYPTPSANTATFAGAWGTYPYLPSGNVLISDSSYGLFIVTLKPVPAAGIIGLSLGNINVNETVSSVSIDVLRANGSAGALNVNYTTTNGTAIAGSDYEAVSGSLNWVDGEDGNKTITVNILDDNIQEGAESFTINLTDFSDTNTAGLAEVTINIAANDVPPAPPPSESGGSTGGSSGPYLLLMLVMAVIFRIRSITLSANIKLSNY